MPRKKNSSLDLSFKIERSNELNMLSPKGLSLTEVRFLAIYQSKINARNPETRTVVFSLKKFCEIMEINQLTVTYIKNVADSIICKPIHLPSTSGKNGFMAVPMFTKCEVYQDDNTMEWFVKIKCSEEILPYMFQMKKNYFSYELWNALKLKSVNQVRMYEILKQYEKIGFRIITLDDLKSMLGIQNGKQEKYQDFRREVIEVCQVALEKYTDIKFDFEPIKKGRKIYALKFNIVHNENFVDDLRLKEFIKPEDLEDIKYITPELCMPTIETEQFDRQMEDIKNLYYRCNKEYTINQLKTLVELARNLVENNFINMSEYNYILLKYRQIKSQDTEIKDLFSYTKAIINRDTDKFLFPDLFKNETKKKVSYEDNPSYDLDEYIDNLHKYY
ncbi:MAG: replication initiation protein [Oscillospiraceae bacterium]